ncbi:DUF4132 domain-containing protein [Luteolibacter arcticus]|uniref:DUF4132 domain-containing protein n=1 Tax=Luteolibacter arcticus TaxID=1581411 RepID=A0ABT3GJA9_9BACT|nr:DUF4132 domain-containing protein [Luteolibacter arcticus]MCW1923610.1 DUF4132 domain-containing protein [Luteolibacter arcticus]
MIPEIERLKERSLPDPLVQAASQFIETGDPAIARKAPKVDPGWESRLIGEELMGEIAWGDRARQLVRFFIHLSEGATPKAPEHHDYLSGILRYLHDGDHPASGAIAAEVIAEIESLHQNIPGFLVRHLGRNDHFTDNWQLAADPAFPDPFVSPVANFILRHITPDYAAKPDLLTSHDGIFPALALHQPEVTRAWCEQSLNSSGYRTQSAWTGIVGVSKDFDSLCLAYCETAAKTDPGEAFPVLKQLDEARGGIHSQQVAELASIPETALGHEALGYLLEKRDAEVIGIMARAFAWDDAGGHVSCPDGPEYRRLYSLMIERWESGGSELLRNLVGNFNAYQLPDLLTEELKTLRPEHYPVLREGVLQHLKKLPAKGQAGLWKVVAASHPAAFMPDFEELLIGKSKPLRETAAGALAKAKGKGGLECAIELLGSKKSDARWGAAAFLEKLAASAAAAAIQAALEQESSSEVREALHKALRACGVAKEATAPSAPASHSDLEASIAKQAAKLKVPATSWLKLDALPQLPTTNATPLSPEGILFLISKQSKHKTLDAAPDILPLLAHIDREKSAPFGLALVEGFLNSEQAASDRWALALGGLVGDNRIIPPLLSRIPDWCENSRHKLAEYAAQAISLLPGNEPLMVLDTLANRYRSKFKNVGRACAAAFNAAAEARGITPDELGDMVVPDFGFDADGIRRFEWDGGGASAELGADFKLSWFDPETDKAWKNLPASAPATVKEEVKTVGKLLREAVKGQTARLEMALVRQRRWPVARWRELYENHPLLRSFASGLVWGIYDASGSLLRTFRRYPNGLLANATGDLEELPESDASIGMVHPLELDAAALEAWGAHLARFKVKQPFPQIARPVELLDPLHGNRREIALTKDKSVGAGTFKSRSEKRGWVRGSVIDAGGISSIYKPFPGAGCEAILPTENYYMGIDPMDSVELGAAYFVKADTVGRGGYTYDEPGPDDPRVLRFDQVPAVVWSETVADLKAIVGAEAR